MYKRYNIALNQQSINVNKATILWNSVKLVNKDA